MRLKTSLFNTGLIKSDLKRFWWVSFFYMMLLFFNLPIKHLITGEPEMDRWQKEMIQRSLDLASGQNEFQILLIVFVPVIIAVLLFKYLHSGRSAAMMHSLPLTRGILYISHSTAGLVLLIIPVIITGLLLMAIQSATFLNECYTIGDILHWLGYSLLFDILFYAVTVFVGMFTGSSIAQIVFTYILHLLPEGFNVLMTYSLQELLYGYPSRNIQESIINNLPISILLNGRLKPEFFTSWHIGAYILAVLVIFAAAYYAYKIRKLESAGDIVSFSMIRPVFKYGVTISAMLLGGAYFGSISGGDFLIIVFGYIFSSFIGYWVAEILMQKSFRVWRSYKGYLVYALLFTAVLVGITTDVFGYVHRVPDPAQVERVYFGFDINAWNRSEIENIAKAEQVDDDTLYSYANYLGGYFFESPDNIRNMTLLHQQIVNEPPQKEGAMRYIIYTLKNGGHLIRQYRVDDQKYASQLEPVYESLEYKKARFPVLTQDPDEIKWIEINDERSPKRPAILSDSREINEFTDLLKKELINTDFNQLVKQKQNYISIRIADLNEETQHYALEKDYTSLIRWLERKEYYENLVLLPHEIEYVVLEKQKTEFSAETNTADPRKVKKVEVHDPKVIEELMDLCASFQYKRDQEPVMVGFYIKGISGRYQFTGNIYQNTAASEALKGYLRQLDS